MKVSWDNVSGWGETGVFGSGILGAYASILKELIAPLLGKYTITSPYDVETFLEKVMLTAGNCGVVTGAISSVEMAMWDARARKLDTSLAEMLGGRVRERVPVYGSFPRFKSSEDVVSTVVKTTERGYKMIKLHQPPSSVVEDLHEIR
ncbi:MAG: mandelate racemase/muconate lactonizing enzyme family protein, partial [Metallosphaera sp.]